MLRPSRLASSSRRHRHRPHIFRDPVALLHSRASRDGLIPALDVGVLLHVDGLPFEARDPGPDSDVGDRILIGNELAAFKPRIEHLVETLTFLQVALLGVGALPLLYFTK